MSKGSRRPSAFVQRDEQAALIISSFELSNKLDEPQTVSERSATYSPMYHWEDSFIGRTRHPRADEGLREPCQALCIRFSAMGIRPGEEGESGRLTRELCISGSNFGRL